MTQTDFAAVLDAERAGFDSQFKALELDDRLALFEFKRSSIEAGSVVVPMAPTPIEHATLLLERGFDSEELGDAALRAVEILRPHGKTVLLGAALLGVLREHRRRAKPELLAEMAIEAAVCFESAGMRRLLGHCLSELGTTFRDGGFAYDALCAYARAKSLLDETGDRAGAGLVAYHLGTLAQAAQLHEEALAHFGDAETICSRLGDRMLNGRAQSAFESGDVVSAMSAVEKMIANETVDPQPLEFNLAIGYSLRARIHEYLDRQDKAVADLHTALGLASKTIRKHDTRMFRSSERQQLQPLFDQALRVSLRADNADLALAAVLCEKSVVPSSLRPVATPFNRSVSSSVPGIADAVEKLVASATAATMVCDVYAMHDASLQASELIDRAEIFGRGATEAIEQYHIPTAEGICRWLRPDEVIVEFVTVDRTVWAISLCANGVRSHPVLMPELELIMLAASARAELNVRQAPRALNRLGHFLLSPLRDLIDSARRAYFILPKTLQAMPLHAVEIDGRPLVSRIEVAYLPSMEFLNARSGTFHEDVTSHVVSVSDPRYEMLEPLEFAADEAASIARRLASTTVLAHDVATADAFRRLLRGNGLLHVATHAAFEPHAPLLARLLLADRPVFAFEIALEGCSLTAVNLSGCSTAAQATRPGGEADGLAAAFLAAGVPAVVASWWPVHDAAAAAFNDAFYQHVYSPSPVDVWTAANAAQRELLDTPEYGEPALWAPFVVLGTPNRSGA
ncbi:CHAT domain-containing protein [Mycolicibacterium llatzerense]|uniref:CHAT domain-containing protein n=1 Tax=Mycolicibacterium llatzerense TaxID=280871 RepID=UPI0008DD3706|nr:CHAT domain-containing protein [Mycolicibacterium llatzerense]